jgi:hypothetical protein
MCRQGFFKPHQHVGLAASRGPVRSNLSARQASDQGQNQILLERAGDFSVADPVQVSLGDAPGLRVQTQELLLIRRAWSQDLADRRRDDVVASDRPAEYQRCRRQGN